MTIVKVDRASIKKNPDYDKYNATMREYTPGLKEIRINCVLSKSVKHLKEVRLLIKQPSCLNLRTRLIPVSFIHIARPIAEHAVGGEDEYQVELQGIGGRLPISEADGTEVVVDLDKGDFSIGISRQSIEITDTAPPEYICQYENPDIKCRHCMGIFPFNELRSDYWCDADGKERHSDEICPECLHPNCADVEYEDTYEVAKEEGLIPVEN